MNRALPSRGLAFVAPHVARVRFRSDGLANRPIPASVGQDRQGIEGQSREARRGVAGRARKEALRCYWVIR